MKKILSKAGFIKINKKIKIWIIPNYFEPFIRRNVDIKYFTDLKNLKNLRIFKSDGDQITIFFNIYLISTILVRKL